MQFSNRPKTAHLCSLFGLHQTNILHVICNNESVLRVLLWLRISGFTPAIQHGKFPHLVLLAGRMLEKHQGTRLVGFSPGLNQQLPNWSLDNSLYCLHLRIILRAALAFWSELDWAQRADKGHLHRDVRISLLHFWTAVFDLLLGHIFKTL